MWRYIQQTMRRKKAEMPLLFAFGMSVGLHVSLLLVLEIVGQSGLLASGNIKDVVAEALEEERRLAEAELDINLAPEPEPIPSQFFDVDPSQASEEKPEETPYYGVVDSVAADASPVDDQEQPEFDGSQEQVLKSVDTAPSEVGAAATFPVTEQVTPVEEPMESEVDPEPLVSEIPPEASESVVEDTEGDASLEVIAGESELAPLEEATLRPSLPAMDALELRDSGLRPTPQNVVNRPRTIAEARRQQGMLVGEKLKQEGGVERFRLQSSPDLLATPFGEYDAAVIQAIQQHWFGILSAMPTARNARGKVVLKFYMRPDGSVSDLDIVEDSVGVIQSLVCQKAVSEPAPFGPWPEDMKRLIGTDRREVRFSFFYN